MFLPLVANICNLQYFLFYNFYLLIETVVLKCYMTWFDQTGAVLEPKMVLVAMFFGLGDLGGVSNQRPHHKLTKGMESNE